jgi:uncharacterized protein (TIGR02996 family)
MPMTREEWDRLLDEEPGDLATRYAFADWLEDQDRSAEARAQRWLADNAKWPFDWSRNEEITGFHSWDWYCPEVTKAMWDVPDSCTLGLRMYVRLSRGDAQNQINWADYPTRRAAEEDLVRVLGELGELGP